MKTKEQIKSDSKEKLMLELEVTLKKIEVLKAEVIKLKFDEQYIYDVGADVINIVHGMTRDLLCAIENLNRIRRLLKIYERA